MQCLGTILIRSLSLHQLRTILPHKDDQQFCLALFDLQNFLSFVCVQQFWAMIQMTVHLRAFEFFSFMEIIRGNNNPWKGLYACDTMVHLCPFNYQGKKFQGVHVISFNLCLYSSDKRMNNRNWGNSAKLFPLSPQLYSPGNLLRPKNPATKGTVSLLYNVNTRATRLLFAPLWCDQYYIVGIR